MTTANIRTTNSHATIESTRTKQCWIQNINTVCGRHDDYTFIRFKSIQLNQQLVKSLLSFIISPPHTSTTMATDGIDLNNEDDTGSVLFTLFKQVTYSRSTHT